MTRIIPLAIKGDKCLIVRSAHNWCDSAVAKLKDLVERCSEVTGVPLPTVREISRRLRENDLIQTGVGGRYGGADMKPEHAASRLTALMIVKTSATSMNSTAAT